MTENMNELNLEQMEDVNGGKGYYGGYKNKPAAKAGCKIYQIKPRENLSHIASANRTTVAAIMAVNKGAIVDAGKIRAGYFIYIPV